MVWGLSLYVESVEKYYINTWGTSAWFAWLCAFRIRSLIPYKKNQKNPKINLISNTDYHTGGGFKKFFLVIGIIAAIVLLILIGVRGI